MSYVAVVARRKDDSTFVHVDSSVEESIKSMEAISSHKSVKNVYRTKVSEELFVAYSNGETLVAELTDNMLYGCKALKCVRRKYSFEK